MVGESNETGWTPVLSQVETFDAASIETAFVGEASVAVTVDRFTLGFASSPDIETSHTGGALDYSSGLVPGRGRHYHKTKPRAMHQRRHAPTSSRGSNVVSGTGSGTLCKSRFGKTPISSPR